MAGCGCAKCEGAAGATSARVAPLAPLPGTQAGIGNPNDSVLRPGDRVAMRSALGGSLDGQWVYGWVSRDGRTALWDGLPTVTPLPSPNVVKLVQTGWSVGRLAAPLARARVGEKYPGVEIQDFDAAITQLETDIAAHQPQGGNALETSNWAALNHKVNGFVLRWGQWKTAQASDWWWGDDDRSALTAFKNEYNQIRQQFLEYTSGQTTAPPVDVTPPSYEDDQKEPGAGQQIADTAKNLVYIAGAGLLLYFVGPPLIAATVQALTKSTPKSGGD